jgi:hypothetical protein
MITNSFILTAAKTCIDHSKINFIHSTNSPVRYSEYSLVAIAANLHGQVDSIDMPAYPISVASFPARFLSI